MVCYGISGAVNSRGLPAVMQCTNLFQCNSGQNNLLCTDILAWIHVQELLCQFRSLIMKLEDDARLTGGSKNMASGEHQTRAQELKNQMAQLTQENVIIS